MTSFIYHQNYNFIFMKKIISHILLVLCAGCFVSASKVPTCKCDGVDLHGKVKVVSYAADFKVKIVDYAADLKVKMVEYAPNDCGEWQFVQYAEDFTIQFVEYGEDFTIHFVEYAPGTR